MRSQLIMNFLDAEFIDRFGIGDFYFLVKEFAFPDFLGNLDLWQR